MGFEIGLGISEVMHMFKDVETEVSMYWIGNWIGSYPMCYFISRYWYRGRPQYGDLEMDWGIYEIMHLFKDVETGVSMYWIGNWIGSYPRWYFISRHSYDGKPKYWDLKLDLGISEVMHMFKDVKTVFLWLVMVNPGHISFADIFGSLSLHWYIYFFFW